MGISPSSSWFQWHWCLCYMFAMSCQEGMKETLETWSMKVRILFIFLLPFSHSFSSYLVEIYLNIISWNWSLHLIYFGMCIGGPIGKELACQCRRHKRRGFNPWVRKIPWRKAWQTTPVFLPGESYGQRSLVGYSPWGRKESYMTEWLSSQTGRDNGTQEFTLIFRHYWVSPTTLHCPIYFADISSDSSILRAHLLSKFFK